MSKIEKGDTVSVQGEVVEVDSRGNVKVEIGGQLIWFSYDRFTLVKKREFQIGDVVRIGGLDPTAHYKIVAINKSFAWLHPETVAAVYPMSPAGVLILVGRLTRVTS